MSNRYVLEFILHARNSSPKSIKGFLAEFGDNLTVAQEQEGKADYKVNMETEDPTMVFDLCAQLGRIRSIKVTEE